MAGKSLRTRRIEAGLTQVELADLVGCERGTIGRLENGKRTAAGPLLRERIDRVLDERALPAQ